VTCLHSLGYSYHTASVELGLSPTSPFVSADLHRTCWFHFVPFVYDRARSTMPVSRKQLHWRGWLIRFRLHALGVGPLLPT
jgi:hypothetical protein